MKAIVVAIDGPGGAGKSTVSQHLAQALGYRYVDTGAMYRVIGLLAAEAGIAVDDDARLAALCDATEIEFREVDGKIRTFTDGRDVSEAIRTAEAAQNASRYSTVGAVRDRLVARQRELGREGGVVMEGRDIGTAVFPNAEMKVFLDASPIERARRRAAEMHGDVTKEQIDHMAKEIGERDHRDRNRAHSPLCAAPDAIVIDSTGKGIEDIVEQLLQLAKRREQGLASDM